MKKLLLIVCLLVSMVFAKELNLQSEYSRQSSLATMTSSDLARLFKTYDTISLRTYNGYWKKNIELPNSTTEGRIFTLHVRSSWRVNVFFGGEKVSLTKNSPKAYFRYSGDRWFYQNKPFSSSIEKEPVLDLRSHYYSQTLLNGMNPDKLKKLFQYYDKLWLNLRNGYWTRNIELPKSVDNNSVFQVRRDSAWGTTVKTPDYSISLERGKTYTLYFRSGKWEMLGKNTKASIQKNLKIDMNNVTYEKITLDSRDNISDLYVTGANIIEGARLVIDNGSNHDTTVHYEGNQTILVKANSNANMYIENKILKRKITYAYRGYQGLISEFSKDPSKLSEVFKSYTTIEVKLFNGFWVRSFTLEDSVPVNREFIITRKSSWGTSVNHDASSKSIAYGQEVLFRKEPTKWNDYEKIVNYITDEDIKENLNGSVRGMVEFAQVHTMAPDQEENSLHLVGNRAALLLFIPKKTEKNVFVKIELPDGNTTSLALNPPTKLPKISKPIGFQGTFFKPELEYHKATWSIEISGRWIQPNVKMYIQTNNGTSEVEDITVGGASELYLHNIRLGMLTDHRGLAADPENNDFEGSLKLVQDYYNKVPVAKVTVGNYAPVHLREVVLSDGTKYTDHSNTKGGVYGGDMRQTIAKSMVSGGANNANYGLNSSAPNEYQRALVSQHTIHRAKGNYTNGVITHGLSGGNGMITLRGNTGNEFSHELGHSYGLGHYPGGRENYTFNRHSPLGYDTHKDIFIPAFYMRTDTASTKDNFYGYVFGRDAMAGGATCSHDSRYTTHSPFSAHRIQNHFESRAIFDVNSSTGYRKWNANTKKMEEIDLDTPKMLKQCTNVITLLGFYDPQKKLTSYIYDDFMGNCGNIYADETNNKKDKVCFYEHSNFQGKKTCYDTAGTYSLLGTPEDNSFSSVMFKSPGYNFTVYDGDNQTGTAITSTSSRSFLGNMNDKTTSIKISPVESVCKLVVDYKNGSNTTHFLSGNRHITGKMNRFHVNIDPDKEPQKASIYCGETMLVQKDLKEFDGSNIQPKFTISSN